MDKYIIQAQKTRHTYMLWVSAFLLIFNVYHTKLMSIFLFSASSGSAFVIQGFAVALMLVYFMTDKKVSLYKIEIQPMEWLLILTLVVMLVTTENINENLTYIIRYAVLVLIVVFMKYDEEFFYIIFYCILAAGIVHVAATLWFYFDTDFYMAHIYPNFDSGQKAHLYEQVQKNHHAVGLSNHYSQNGIYMAISLCASFALLLVKKHKNMIRKVLLVAVVFFSLILTGKRGALIFSVFAMLVSYIICKRGAFGNKLITVLFILSSISLVIYILSFYIEGIASAFERITAMFAAENEISDVSNGRFKLYAIAWNFFKESPILGIGWREFSKEVVNFYNQDSVLRDAHNVFLQLLCETGIIGFSVFITMFISAITQTIQLAAQSAKNLLCLSDKTKTVLIFSLCYQVFFLAYCITGNPLYDLETVYVYIISVGFSSGIYFRYKEKIAKIKRESADKSKYIK